MPLSPALEEIDAKIEDLYVGLTITDQLVCQGTRDKRAIPREVHGYTDIFTKNGNQCKNVYVLGDAGIGKTTWCIKLLRSWSIAVEKSVSDTLSENEQFLSEHFDIVIFVSLRLAVIHYDLCDMMKSQVFEEYPNMYENALEIMRNEPERCLIICDGLDEWMLEGPVVNQSSLYSSDLPGRKDINGSVILTTTRPWKLEKIRLSDRYIDRSVTIEGFSNQSKVMTLAMKLIGHMNMKNVGDKKISRNLINFQNDLNTSFKLNTSNKSHTFLRTPLLLTYVICKWYDDGQFGGNMALNYLNIFEFLFDHFERRYSFKVKQDVDEVEDLPSCIRHRPSCMKYTHFLNKLATFAFKTMFDEEGKCKLVFTKEDLRKKLSEEDLEFSIKTGIISQSRAVSKLLTKECRLTFLHKTIQEFLCALHIVFEIGNDHTDALDRLVTQCYLKFKLWENENIILLIVGLDRKSSKVLSKHLAHMADSELTFNTFRIPPTLDLIVKCAEEVDYGCADKSLRRSDVETHIIYFGSGNSTELLKRMDTLFECNKENITTVDMTICFEANVQDKIIRKHSFCSILRNINSAVNLKILKIENKPVSNIELYLFCFKGLIHLEEFIIKDTSAISKIKTGDDDDGGGDGDDDCTKRMSIDLSSSRKLAKLVVVGCLEKVALHSDVCMELVDVECFQRRASKRETVFVYIHDGTNIEKFNIRNFSSSDITIAMTETGEQKVKDTAGMRTSHLATVNVGFSGCAKIEFDPRFNISNIVVDKCSCCYYPVRSMESLQLGNRITQRICENLKESSRLRHLMLIELSDEDVERLNCVLPSLPSLEALEVNSPGNTYCLFKSIGQCKHLNEIKISFTHMAELPAFFNQLDNAKSLEHIDFNFLNSMFQGKASIEAFKLSNSVTNSINLSNLELLLNGFPFYTIEYDKMKMHPLINLVHFLIEQSTKCNVDELINRDDLQVSDIDTFAFSLRKSQIEAYISTVFFRCSDLNTGSLRNLSSLKSLKLGGVTQDMFKNIGAQFPYLQHLSTIELNGLLWLYIDAEEVFGCLKNLVSLKCLNLRHLSHACYRAVGTVYSDLRYLQVLEVEEIADRLCPEMLKQIPCISGLKSLSCGALTPKKTVILANVLKEISSLETFSCEGSEQHWYGYLHFDFNSYRFLKHICLSRLDIEMDQWLIFEQNLPAYECTVELNHASIHQDDVIGCIKSSKRITSQRWEAIGPYMYNIKFTLLDKVS